MALSDVTVRTAKPKEKPYKLTDEKGLFLLVQPSGGKLWRLKFRIDDKEQKLSLGRYPEVGLKDARIKGKDARREIAAGGNPAAEKKREKAARALSAATTFKAIADEYIDKTEREGRAEATVSKSRWVLSLMETAVGNRPIAEIEPPELLAVLKKLEAEGNLETAKRMRAFASRVFRYAVATGRAKNDPAAPLQGALTAPIRKHHGAILEPKRVGELLRAIDGYEGQPITKIALRFAPHVFVRPGEMRRGMGGDRSGSGSLAYPGTEDEGAADARCAPVQAIHRVVEGGRRAGRRRPLCLSIAPHAAQGDVGEHRQRCTTSPGLLR
jgi:hypothetical protein